LKLIEGTTEPNLQVVSCAPFQPTLWLQFSTVALNTSHSKLFKILNPSKQNVSIQTEKISAQVGISSYVGHIGNTSAIIDPEGSLMGFAIWSPSNNMFLSEMVKLKVNDKYIMNIKLTGIAGTGEVYIYVLTRNHSR
jgi:hypothetical protein